MTKKDHNIEVLLRFYEELNDYLPIEKQKKDIFLTTSPHQTIQALILACGIPDAEVDLVLVNGRSVPFSYVVKHLDRISVYPKFESFDISAETKLRKKPLRDLRFILDVHLGKLAKYMRMLGFDSLYQNDYTDNQIIMISKKTGRVILTRDKALLKSKAVSRGYLLKNTEINSQIKEVVDRFQLLSLAKPFSLCLSCNLPVKRVEKESLKETLPPLIYSQFTEFSKCPGCGKIFWKGSHYSAMKRFIQALEEGEKEP